MNVNSTATSASVSAATDQSLASAALMQQQAPTSSDETTAPILVSVYDPVAAAARVAKYDDAFGAPLKMGNDARNIAYALTSSMRAVVSERPDLANAHFDFQSNNGRIQVTSKDMSASDVSWLQGKLNGNSSLLSAVKAYHDDAVSGYAKWSEADGTPLTESQAQSVSAKADKLGGFMALFQSLGQDAQRYQMTDGYYKSADGSKIDLGQDPATASSFLQFVKSAQSMEDGTSSFVSNSGHNSYGDRMDVFQNTSVIPNFFPDPNSKTLGFSQVA